MQTIYQTPRHSIYKYSAEDAVLTAAINTLQSKLHTASVDISDRRASDSIKDLTQFTTSFQVTETTTFDGGQASVSLVIYPEDYANKYSNSSAPVNILDARELSALNPDVAIRRLLKMGDFIHIVESSYTGSTPVFLGVITSLTTQVAIDDQGMRMMRVELNCANFMYLFMMSQLRLTPVGDNLSGAPLLSDLLATIDTAAVAQYADYRTGFLQAVLAGIQSTSGVLPTATFLQKVVSALGHYKLPQALGGGRLGDNIVVLDGGTTDPQHSFTQAVPDDLLRANRLGAGNDADVVRGTPLSKYKAGLLSNITHAEIISSIFMSLPVITELFPVILPARSVPKTAIESAAGVMLALVYRFKPCTPENGPTLNAHLRALARKGVGDTPEAQALYPKTPTYCEAYFGPTISNSHFIVLTSTEVHTLDLTLQDAEHYNAVFIEQPWGRGDSHNGNLIRATAPLVCDVRDVNRYGLRCFSAVHPFISTATSTPQQRLDWELAGRAVPERVFHSFGMNNEFFSGQLTTFTLNPLLRAGVWLQISPPLPATNTTYPLEASESFLCYITGVSTAVEVSDDGIARQMHTIAFVRGSYGVNIPVPNSLDGPNSTVQNLRQTAAERARIAAEWNI